MDNIKWVKGLWAVTSGDEDQAVVIRQAFKVPCVVEGDLLVLGPLNDVGVSFREDVVYGEGDSPMAATADYLRQVRDEPQGSASRAGSTPAR
jgi:hypothetical protein